jgi:hypothetical protein
MDCAIQQAKGSDFHYAFWDVYATSSLQYVVGQANIQQTCENGNPQSGVSYWTPIENGTEASLTFKFPFGRATASIFLNASFATYNFGNGDVGSGSLWGSTDGLNWVSLLDAPTPQYPGYEYGWSSNYATNLPNSLIGSSNLWIQARLQSSGWNIMAQFLRQDTSWNTNNVFQLDANLVPLSPSAPTISVQPQSITVNAQDTASFSVTALGGPLSYQWSFNGSNILGATSSSLVISNVAQANLGTYAVVVANAIGAMTSSNAVLSMYPYLYAPFSGLVTDWGCTNTLSVGAWGTGPLSYQWYDNGSAILNATNSTLTLASVQFTNAGSYSVVVSNPFGNVTNAPAQVVVNPAGVSFGMYPGVTISGVVGYSYIIQSNPDLTNTNGWSAVATVTLMQPVQLWVDVNVNATSPMNPHRFYRVMPAP